MTTVEFHVSCTRLLQTDTSSNRPTAPTLYFINSECQLWENYGVAIDDPVEARFGPEAALVTKGGMPTFAAVCIEVCYA